MKLAASVLGAAARLTVAVPFTVPASQTQMAKPACLPGITSPEVSCEATATHRTSGGWVLAPGLGAGVVAAGTGDGAVIVVPLRCSWAACAAVRCSTHGFFVGGGDPEPGAAVRLGLAVPASKGAARNRPATPTGIANKPDSACQP